MRPVQTDSPFLFQDGKALGCLLSGLNVWRWMFSA